MILAVIILILRIAMAVLLFLFLGWMFYTLWRDLKFQTQILTAKKVPHISVYLEDDPAEAKRIFTSPELTIGRDTSNDIQVDDNTVSSHHARLSYRNMQWWVEDLLSTNGTFLNDERVDNPTILINGDKIQVGKVILTVEIQPLE